MLQVQLGFWVTVTERASAEAVITRGTARMQSSGTPDAWYLQCSEAGSSTHRLPPGIPWARILWERFESPPA